MYFHLFHYHFINIHYQFDHILRSQYLTKDFLKEAIQNSL
jgi:hypothetical protein